MKVIMCNYYHSPIDGRVFYKEALSLKKLYEIKKVTILYKEIDEMIYDTGKIPRGTKEEWNEKFDKIDFLGYKGLKNANNIILKIIDRFIVMLRMIQIFIKNRDEYDVLHCHESFPVITAAVIAKKILWLIYGKKVVIIYDIHENHIEVMSKGNVLLKIIIKRLEKFHVSVIDGVITVGSILMDYYANTFNLTLPKVIIYNSRPLNNVRAILKKNDYDKFIIIHEGSLGIERGSRQIGRAMDLLAKLSGKYCLKVVGTLKDDFLRNKKWLKVCGWIKYEDLDKYLASADIGINYITSENAKYGIPNKVFGYISVGLPVVTLEGSETALLIEKYEFGIVVKRDDYEDLYNAIIKISSDKKLYDRYSNNSVKLFNQLLSWELQEQKLFVFYKEYIKKFDFS